MTQNPYPGPPPGWQPPPYPQPPQPPQPSAYPGGQPDPSYAPQGYPQGGQFQAPPGPSPFTQAGPAGAPPISDDVFGAPGAGRNTGDSPAVHQLKNRLLLVKPTRPIDPNAKAFNKVDTEEAVDVEIVVLDGGPIDGNLNGETDQFTPFATGAKVVPFYMTAIFNKALLDRVRIYAAGGEMHGRWCLGRLVYKPSKVGKPWPDLVDPTEADQALARTVVPRLAELKAAAAPVQQVAPPGPPAAYPQPQAQQYQPAYGTTPQVHQQAPAGYPQPGQPPAQQQYPAAYGQPPAGYPEQYPPAGQAQPGYPPY